MEMDQSIQQAEKEAVLERIGRGEIVYNPRSERFTVPGDLRSLLKWMLQSGYLTRKEFKDAFEQGERTQTKRPAHKDTYGDIERLFEENRFLNYVDVSFGRLNLQL